ncbi:MAG: FeoB-associated Cys-rich membrane protein [Planctomycetaceae bacterium]|jgi:hypothetical protein|nr:FeoB-associated Cys-rich membrane protein [bacterium]MDG2388363.1 FeoB-associated Cys-rich membrane protein [Planctomycetaceae bacterium]
MTPILENILIWLIVGTATFALGRRFYQFVTQAGQSGSCGSSCGGCGPQKESSASAKPLVQLEMTSEKSS